MATQVRKPTRRSLIPTAAAMAALACGLACPARAGAEESTGDGKTRYHALLIGNDEGATDIDKIRTAMQYWNCWKDPKTGRVPAPKKNLDGRHMLHEIKKWVSKIDGDDVAVFWYIGHSGKSADEAGEDGDERYNDPTKDNDDNPDDRRRTRNVDEFLGKHIGNERFRGGRLTDDMIGRELRKIKEGATLLAVFNTCYAYGQWGGKDDLGGVDDEGNETLENGAILASSCENKKSEINAKWSAKVLLGTFDHTGNGRPDADGNNPPDSEITAAELAAWAKLQDSKTESTVRLEGASNRPIFTGFNPGGEFPFDGFQDPDPGLPGFGFCSDPDCGDAPAGGMVCWDVARYYRTRLDESQYGPRYNEWELQCLGDNVNYEEDGQPGCGAGADAYDDGVVRRSYGAIVTVTIAHPDPKDYRLDAWFDVDDDGEFDEASEHIIDSRVDYNGLTGGLLRDLTTGVYDYPYVFLFNSRKVYCRFRLTFGIDVSIPILSHDEETENKAGYVAPDGSIHGEVEDYPPIRGCGNQSLVDTLWITDDYAYDNANANALSGIGPYGQLFDTRLADDFEVSADDWPDGFVIECVTADYLALWGSPPAEGAYVRIYDDDDGKPAEPPIHEVLIADATTTNFFDPLFELWGLRLTADGLGLAIAPGRYWINIQPVDTTPNGDWFFQVRDLNEVIGYDTHVRDGDLGQGTYGHTDWRSTGEDGYGAGTAAMQILGDAAPCQPPVITEHPIDQVECEAGVAAFSVAAEGRGPLGYQWRMFDVNIDQWVDIPDAIEDVYTIDGVTPAHSGLYDVLVGNDCSSVTSNAVTLIVNEAPNIAFQPVSQSSCIGAAAVFSVSAASEPPASYKWREFDEGTNEWVDIPDATDFMLVIDPVTQNDVGDYDVVISNDCGAAISSPASLDIGAGGTLDNGVVRASFSDYGVSGRRFPHQGSVSAEIAWLEVSEASQVWSWEGNLSYNGANHLLNDADVFSVVTPACAVDETATSESQNNEFNINATHSLDGATLTTELEITNISGGTLTDVRLAWMLDADLKPDKSDPREPCCPNVPWLGFGSGRWFGGEGAGVQTNVNPCAGIWPADIAVTHAARMDASEIPGEWMVGNPIGFQGATCQFDGQNETEPRYLFEQPFDNTSGCVGFGQDLSLVTNFTLADWPDGVTHTFTYTLTFRKPGDADADGSVGLHDFAARQDCVTGPDAGPIGAACETFDFDCDDDVDLIDFAAFQLAITEGP